MKYQILRRRKTNLAYLYLKKQKFSSNYKQKNWNKSIFKPLRVHWKKNKKKYKTNS